ncbi:MAG: nucleotidyltransferase family protein, partial [Lachnospiraceae bacterium]|nr:nucleotidyltransferase family protein [Lachnospiraceae bacterium]
YLHHIFLYIKIVHRIYYKILRKAGIPMSTAAIIAEYNPFHTGHLYQIEEVRKHTNAEHILIIMSGNYVQRGCPAVFDKYTRTKMALNCGCDAVIELPVYYACASAEYFAKGAVNLIEQCGCVDYVCFGCETENLSLISDIADILINETEQYKHNLKFHIKSGKPFAVSRTNAILSCLSGCCQEEAAKILSSPNCILAIEYIKALKFFNSDITPVIIKREQSYHSMSLNNDFASASAIRKGIFNNSTDVTKFIPPQCLDIFRTGHAMSENDFSDYLLHSIIYGNNLYDYFDVSEFMANSILKNTDKYCIFSDLAYSISGKHTTTTHSYRGLLHILLKIYKNEITEYINHDYNMYIRLLGFRKSHSNLLSELNKNSSLPIISKMSDAHRLLSEDALNMLIHNVKCDNLYRITMQKKYNLTNVKNEYNTGIIVV